MNIYNNDHLKIVFTSLDSNLFTNIAFVCSQDKAYYKISLDYFSKCLNSIPTSFQKESLLFTIKDTKLFLSAERTDMKYTIERSFWIDPSSSDDFVKIDNLFSLEFNNSLPIYNASINKFISAIRSLKPINRDFPAIKFSSINNNLVLNSDMIDNEDNEDKEDKEIFLSKITTTISFDKYSEHSYVDSFDLLFLSRICSSLHIKDIFIRFSHKGILFIECFLEDFSIYFAFSSLNPFDSEDD